MLRFLGSRPSRVVQSTDTSVERYSRFDTAQPSESPRPKYTRMAVRPNPKPVANVVDMPRLADPIDSVEAHPEPPVEPAFNDNAHLYADDSLSVDVLRQALPRRFIQMKSAI